MGRGATAGAGRQEFVTATWVEWRRQLAPLVPPVDRQIRACRVFAVVFEQSRRAGIEALTTAALARTRELRY